MVKTRNKKRLSPFSLRLTAQERAQLERDAVGVSLAEHVKAILFKDAPRPQKRGKHPVKDHQALGEVLAKLGSSRISSNLNQLAYAANIGTLSFDLETTRQLNEAYQHVREIRDLLIQSLGLREAVDAQTEALAKRVRQRVAVKRARPAFNGAAQDRGVRP